MSFQFPICLLLIILISVFCALYLPSLLPSWSSLLFDLNSLKPLIFLFLQKFQFQTTCILLCTSFNPNFNSTFFKPHFLFLSQYQLLALSTPYGFLTMFHRSHVSFYFTEMKNITYMFCLLQKTFSPEIDLSSQDLRYFTPFLMCVFNSLDWQCFFVFPSINERLSLKTQCLPV